MRKEAIELNNNIEEIGDAVSGTVLSIIPLFVQIIDIPWAITRFATEETSGAIDQIIG